MARVFIIHVALVVALVSMLAIVSSGQKFTSLDMDALIAKADNGDFSHQIFNELSEGPSNLLKSNNGRKQQQQQQAGFVASFKSLIKSMIPGRIKNLFGSINENYHLKEKLLQFKNFMASYHKEYDVKELPRRINLFMENLNAVKQSQLDRAAKKTNYELEINKFADMDDEDIVRYSGKMQVDATQKKKLKQSRETQKDKEEKLRLIKAASQSSLKTYDWESKDWRESGCILPVRDQGQCGSCYAFSTLGVIESMLCLKNKTKIVLAPQHIVDCSIRNHGCNGGLETRVFDYLNEFGRIAKEDSYRYYAKRYTCMKYTAQSTSNSISADLSGKDNGRLFYRELNNRDDIELYLRYHGPLSGSLHVTRNMIMYKKGVYSEPNPRNCQKPANHAIMLVGLGEENGEKYWLFKNSYGTGWGDNGYIKVKRGVNMCMSEAEAYVVY